MDAVLSSAGSIRLHQAQNKRNRTSHCSPIPEAGLEGYTPSQFPAPCSCSSRACRVLQHLQGHQQPFAEPPKLADTPGRRLRHFPSLLSPRLSPRQAQLRPRSIQHPTALAPIQQGRSPHPLLKPPSTSRETCCLQFFYYFF